VYLTEIVVRTYVVCVFGRVIGCDKLDQYIVPSFFCEILIPFGPFL